MFERIRAASVDGEGRRLPIKTVAIKLVSYLLLAMLGFWVASLLVVLYPMLFIAIGAAVAGVYYYRRWGLALPPDLRAALAARKATTGEALPVEKTARAVQVTGPTNGKQIGRR